VIDIVITCIMSVLACVVAVGSLWFSITWGGVGLAEFIGGRPLSQRPCANE